MTYAIVFLLGVALGASAASYVYGEIERARLSAERARWATYKMPSEDRQ